MAINIKAYQDACDIALNKLKSNSQVLAIIVYGSIISGDLWENSDIDIMVISQDRGKSQTIYSKILDVPLHINYISKDVFVDSYNSMLKGGSFHKVFFMGKLVYCIDSDIEEIHGNTRVYGDRDKAIRNIEFLCNLLNSVHFTKKYMYTGKHETAFQWSVEMLKNYARILMNSHGHLTDNDILSFAVNMNMSVENIFVSLNDDKPLLGRLNYIVDATEKFINQNIESIAQPIVQFLRQENNPYSVTELQASEDFKQVDTDMNVLLQSLSERGLIRERSRSFTTLGNEYLIDEIVYCAD